MTNATDTARRAALPWWALLLAVLLVLPGLAATSGSVYAEDEMPAEEAEDEKPTEDPTEEPTEEPTEPPKAELPWVKDVAAAKKQAAEEGKDLFINFTGSDWCGWCHRLDDEVFTHAAFVDAASKNFVFVFLDFPKAEELRAAVVDQALNEKLQEQYGVQGFPTIILATADGHPYARTPYQPGGPEAYLELLAEKRKGGDAVKKLLANKEDGEALKAAFPVLAEASFLAYPDYAFSLEAVEKLDPKGEHELLPIVQAYKENKAFQDLLPKSREETPDFAVLGKFLLESKYMKGGDLLNPCLGIARALVETNGDLDLAKSLIEKVKDDPIFTENERAAQFRDMLLKRIDEAQNPPVAEEEPEDLDEEQEEDHPEKDGDEPDDK